MLEKTFKFSGKIPFPSARLSLSSRLIDYTTIFCTLNLSTNRGKRKEIKKTKHGDAISHFTPVLEREISARAKMDLLSCQSTGLAPTERDGDQISLVETLCLSDRTGGPKPLTRSALICWISAPVVGQLLIEWTRLPNPCKPHDFRVWLTLNISFILSLFSIVLWITWELCDKVLCWLWAHSVNMGSISILQHPHLNWTCY